MTQRYNPSTLLSDANNRVNLTSEDIIKDYHKQKIAEYLQYKSNLPAKTKARDIAQMCHVSRSTMDRIRKNVGCPSLHQHLIKESKPKKFNQSSTQSPVSELSHQNNTYSRSEGAKLYSRSEGAKLCTTCNKEFKTPGSLKTHITKTHKTTSVAVLPNEEKGKGTTTSQVDTSQAVDRALENLVSSYSSSK